jgi:signal transduction histidine kinase
VAGGLVFLLSSANVVGTLSELVLALAIVLVGVTLIFGTSWFGLLSSLREERNERVRSQERAEMAAHLHDSVLQTLALIQKRAGDDREVATLARRQERELRDWLSGRTPAAGGPQTVAAALRAMAADVEITHAVTVEVVTVGDAPLDDRLRALVAAAREAAVNAAKFAGTGAVDVFAEADGDRVEVFVRDRGAGFALESVDPQRRGLRESVVGRMQRHGGAATVRTAPGEGTEVELTMRRSSP